MNATELANLIAEPIQTLGMSFYFDPPTGERAKELGLNVFEFYGLGRAGTLGDVDASVVTNALTFFHARTIDFLWSKAKTKADPVTTARAYLEAAYEFADRTFGALDVVVLEEFAHAVHRVVASVESGHHLLFDGYRSFDVPSRPVHAAYFSTILLRELRGGAHIDAVSQVGLTPLQACYIQDPTIFTMHGYTDDDVFDVTPEMREMKERAEVLTSETMASYFEVLSDDERRQVATGARAMFEALASPAAVL